VPDVHSDSLPSQAVSAPSSSSNDWPFVHGDGGGYRAAVVVFVDVPVVQGQASCRKENGHLHPRADSEKSLPAVETSDEGAVEERKPFVREHPEVVTEGVAETISIRLTVGSPCAPLVVRRNADGQKLPLGNCDSGD